MNDKEPDQSIDFIECKNCHNHFQGNFCNKCGQKVMQDRNTLKRFFNLVFESIDVQKGVLYTAKLLFTNPGKLVNEYLDGRTKDYYNPLKYLLIIAGINAIVMLSFNIFDTNVENTNELLGETGEGNKLQLLIIGYLKRFLNIFPLLIIPFYSLVSKWVFKKHKLYYAEHLIINSYLFAQYTLLQMITYLLLFQIPGLSELSLAFGIVVFISYYTYAFRSIFSIRFLPSFLSALGIIFIGVLIFIVFLMVVMIVILLILKFSGVDIKELVK